MLGHGAGEARLRGTSSPPPTSPGRAQRCHGRAAVSRRGAAVTAPARQLDIAWTAAIGRLRERELRPAARGRRQVARGPRRLSHGRGRRGDRRPLPRLPAQPPRRAGREPTQSRLFEPRACGFRCSSCKATVTGSASHRRATSALWCRCGATTACEPIPTEWRAQFEPGSRKSSRRSEVFLAGPTRRLLGVRLVPLLVEAGHAVAGRTRSPEKAANLRALGAEPVVCNLFDTAALRAAVVSFAPDAVIHQPLIFRTTRAGSTSMRRRTTASDAGDPQSARGGASRRDRTALSGAKRRVAADRRRRRGGGSARARRARAGRGCPPLHGSTGPARTTRRSRRRRRASRST